MIGGVLAAETARASQRPKPAILPRPYQTEAARLGTAAPADLHDGFDERGVPAEFDGGMTRAAAEQLALVAAPARSAMPSRTGGTG